MKSLVGERKALAAAVLAFYGFFYTLVTLSGPPPGLEKITAALAGVYGVGFFGLVAGYFWARWFAVGLSLFGVIEGAVGMWQMGAEPIVLFILITHGVAALFLWGDSMAALFDGQSAWREKLSMDEGAVNRLGNAVTRLGVSLPLVLIWALAPKAGALAIGAGAAVMLAAAGVLRLRTWGVLAMLGSAGLVAGSIATAPSVSTSMAAWTPISAALAAVAAVLLVAGAVPFFGPIRRFVRG